MIANQQIRRVSKLPEHFLYSNVIEDKGKLHCFGYDVDTKEKIHYMTSSIDDLSYYLESRDPNAEYSTLVTNIPVTKYQSKTIYDFKKMMNQDSSMIKVHGCNNVPHHFINNTCGPKIRNNIDYYLKAAKELINIGIIDIETDVGNTKIDVYECRYKITAISIYCTRSKKIYILTDKDLTDEGFSKLEATLKHEKSRSRFALDKDASIEVRQYDGNEEQMLVDLARIIVQEEKLDVITGWNSAGFDIPYIYFRSRKLFGMDGPTMFSPIGSCHEYFHKKKKQWVISLKGLALIDSMDWYKEFTKNIKILPQYSLNYVCNHEISLSKAKLHGSLKTTYEKYYDDYINYNLIDVIRLVQLINHKKFFLTAFVIMYKYYSIYSIEKVLSPVLGWENIILQDSIKEKKVFPHRPKRIEEAHSFYPGAYVHKPIPGLYKNLVSFDVNSMYPHIQMSWFISPETHITDDSYILELFNNHPACKAILDLRNSAPHYTIDADTQSDWWDNNVIHPLLNGDIDLSFLKLNDKICMAPSLEFFWKDENALLPKRLRSIYGDRKIITKEEDELSIRAQKIKATDPELYKDLQEQISFKLMEEIALKIVINAEYGANGSTFYHFYNVRIARSITITGRFLIIGSSKFVDGKYKDFLLNEFNYKDINSINSRAYNDTDSVYFSFTELMNLLEKSNERKFSVEEKVDALDAFAVEIVNPWINEFFQSSISALNGNNEMVMKRELIALDGCFRGIKKHYALLINDKKGTRYEKPKLYLKGAQFVSISIPKKCKEKYDEILRILVASSSPSSVKDKIINMIDDFRKQFKTFNLEELCQAIAVNDLEKYIDINGNHIKGATKQSKASNAYNKYITKMNLVEYGVPLIRSGDRVRLLPLKDGHCYGSNIDTFAFIDEIPKGFDERFIDYEDLFERNFLSYPHELFKELGLKWNLKPSTNMELDDDAF